MWKAIRWDRNFGDRSILGEVRFQGWNGMTYFDVSAVDNCCDNDGVRTLRPWKAPKLPVSGCDPARFPCNNAYKKPNDVQTKTTWETGLICDFSQR